MSSLVEDKEEDSKGCSEVARLCLAGDLLVTDFGNSDFSKEKEEEIAIMSSNGWVDLARTRLLLSLGLGLSLGLDGVMMGFGAEFGRGRDPLVGGRRREGSDVW